jgi:hypothetical protein
MVQMDRGCVLRASYIRMACRAWAILISVAAGSVASAQAMSGFERFIELYRCPVRERLELIHADKTHPGDRFFVLMLAGQPERYVQCLFFDEDRKVLCEAASGFYAHLPGKPNIFGPNSHGIAALAQLGFSTDGSSGNYQIELETTKPGALKHIADLMLTALYEAYGAYTGSRLRFISPLAPEVDRIATACVPVG